MTICTKCKQERKEADFFFRNKDIGSRHSVCKVCQRIYKRKWYRKNRERQKNAIYARRNKMRGWLCELKTGLCCIRCGENHPACLDFHHTVPENKDVNVSGAIARGWSKKRTLKEIKKCDVLCSNCHRKIHWANSRSVV